MEDEWNGMNAKQYDGMHNAIQRKGMRMGKRRRKMC